MLNLNNHLIIQYIFEPKELEKYFEKIKEEIDYDQNDKKRGIDLYWEAGDFPNGNPIIDYNTSVKQTTKDPDEKFGGFVDEWASLMINLRYEYPNWVVNTSWDDSRFYENADNVLLQKIKEKFPFINIKSGWAEYNEKDVANACEFFDNLANYIDKIEINIDNLA